MAEVERVTEVRETGTERSPIVAARVVHWVFGVIIAFIIVRLVLMLLAANQGSAFVDFIYAISGIFVAPFYGIFNYTPVYGSSVFDVSALVAIIVYALISWGLGNLFTIGSRGRHVAA